MSAVFIAVAASQAALSSSIRGYGGGGGGGYEPEPMSTWGKIGLGVFFTLLGLLLLFFIAFICDEMTATETKVVKEVRLVDVEIDKGRPKHHQGEDLVLYRVSWPNDPTHSWYDQARSPIYCTYTAMAQIGTVKTVWYHERTTKLFHQVQRWTGGGQTFCNQ